MDTGSSASVCLNRGPAVQQRLPGTMKSLGTSRMRGVGDGTARNEVLLLPKMSLGNLELRDLPFHVRTNGPEADDGLSGHLGMDVLKRFNTVLDFQNDVAYFAPSEQNGTAYRFDYDDGRGWWFAAAGALLFSVVTLLWLRRGANARSRAEVKLGSAARHDELASPNNKIAGGVGSAAQGTSVVEGEVSED